MFDCSHMISEKKIGWSIYGSFLSILFLMLILLSAGCASMSDNKEAASGKADSPKVITGINTVVAADSESVLVSANKQLNYTSVKQHDPPGVILLFPETTLGEIPPTLTPDSQIIKTIISSLSSDQKNTRLEIGLKEDLSYEVQKEGTVLKIVFQRPGTVLTEENQAIELNEESAEVENPLSAPVVAGSLEVAAAGKRTEKEVTAGEDKRKNIETAVINRIDFSTQASGKSMIIVGTDLPVKFDIQKIAARTLKVRIYNSRLPEYRRHKPLITTRFESAVDRISPMQATDLKKATDLIIELREWVPYRPVAEDNVLTINFDPSSIGPRPFESANLSPWQQVLDEITYSVPSPETQAKDQTIVEEDPYGDILGGKKVYTGQKIALDFYKTDIKNVFRILQQVSGKNYAVDKNVTGEVTISLDKPIPWDQVLDLILKMNQLGKMEQDNIIRIATTATLSAEEVAQQKKFEAIRSRREQQKTLEPLVTKYIPVNYANAQSEILQHIETIKTPDRGSITVDDRNNQLIITDTNAVLLKMNEIISQIDKVTPQVLIEARIVEVSNNFTRDVGVAWGVSGEDIYRSNMDGQYSYNIAMNTPLLTQEPNQGEGVIDFNFTRLDAWGTPVVLDAALKAMELEGNGKIISSPKILTMNNKKATINQGQEFPYQVVEDDEVSIEYKKVGLLLDVTPHVTPDRRVSLKLKTTKNEITGFIPTGEPITSINEAETELLVNDGETIVIGGVVKNDVKFTETGFPILKDIPMIGWLFKSKNETNSKQELLIFLTPRIVQLEQRDMVQAEN
ncbi:MAG: type IV pilus secretin PilQ [Desulfobacteraceae bacterium]|nr:type IV pilus secretin PilQ [Desulfobacteraceae bacterium]